VFRGWMTEAGDEDEDDEVVSGRENGVGVVRNASSSACCECECECECDCLGKKGNIIVRVCRMDMI